MQSTGMLDVLSFTWSNESGLRLPSWAPDWNAATEWSLLPPREAEVKLYDAAKGSKAVLKPFQHPQDLILSGFCLDTIARIGDVMREKNPTATAASAMACIRSWGEMVGATWDPDQIYVGGGTILEAIQHSIMAGMSTIPSGRTTRTILQPKFGKPTDEDIVLFWNWLEPDYLPALYTSVTRNIFDRRSLDTATAAFIKQIVRVITCRRMVVTSQRYFALVPAPTRVGDQICILLGGSAPFVVRGESGYYTVIGECYVHEVMDGEAMDMNESKELRDFKLR